MPPDQIEQSFVITLYELLTSFTSGGETFPIEFLRSQSSLASYSDLMNGIKGCSLNTLKTKADASIPGGFKELDAQRRRALSYANRLMEKRKTKSGRAKLDLEQKLSSLIKDISSLEEDLLTLSVALESAISSATYYAKISNDQFLIDRWGRERQKILLTLSLRRRFTGK